MTWSVLANGISCSTTDGTYIYYTGGGYCEAVDPTDDSITTIGSPSDFNSRDIFGCVWFIPPDEEEDPALFIAAASWNGSSWDLGVYRKIEPMGETLWSRVYNATGIAFPNLSFRYLWADSQRIIVALSSELSGTEYNHIYYSVDGATWNSVSMPVNTYLDLGESKVNWHTHVSQLQGTKNTPIIAYSSSANDILKFDSGSFVAIDTGSYFFVSFDKEYFYFWDNTNGNVYQTVSVDSPSFTLFSTGSAPFGDYLNLRAVIGTHGLNLRYAYTVDNSTGSYGIRLKYYDSETLSWEYIPGDYTPQTVSSIGSWSEQIHGVRQLYYLNGYLYADSSSPSGGIDLVKVADPYTEPTSGGGGGGGSDRNRVWIYKSTDYGSTWISRGLKT